MNGTTAVGQRVQNLTVSPEYNAYSKVRLFREKNENGKSVYFEAGTDTGLVYEATTIWATQEMADQILGRLLERNFQYQPYNGEDAYVDPAAELGDGITIGNTYSAIFKQETTFGMLMASNVSAPEEKEVEEEFPYKSKAERSYEREVEYTRSRLTVNEDAITAEVERVDHDVFDASNPNSIKATLNVQANEISAKVSKTSANQASTGFGWSLSDSEWKVGPYSSGSLKPVLTINKNGLTVNGSGTFSGKITASEGTIGGITLHSNYGIYTNGKTSATSGNSGFLISKSGAIYMGAYNSTYGACPFQVTASGELTANSGTIGGVTMNRAYGLYTNGKTSRTSTANGFLLSNGGALYIGPYNSSNGSCPFEVSSSGAITATNLSIKGGSIKIGNNFSVNTSGTVTANNMILKGTLNVGGSNITAENLRIGAAQAASNYSSWNSSRDTVSTYSGGWNSAAVSTSTGGFCYTGAKAGAHAYSRAAVAWIGNYQLNFGYGITILGTSFTDSTGGRCDGEATRSNVVTCTYAGGYDD